MTMLHRARSYLHRLLHGRAVEDELAEEVRSYFDLLVEREIAAGKTAEQALRIARTAFGGREQMKQIVREQRMGASIDTTMQDVRYAARALRKSPGFTFFAVLTIALGLGANTAIFSLVDGVLLKASGYSEPERIVQIWEKPPGRLRNGVAAANYIDWTRQAKSFEAMTAITGAALSYTGGGEPKSLRAGVVSAPYFRVYGVNAALGRTFADGEDERGKEKVAVLSHRLWLGQFGGDASLIGKPIRLNGEPYTVIGVLPGNSEFDRRSADLYVPLAFPPQVARNYHYLQVMGRLKRGVSVEQAQAEMSVIADGIARLYPDVKKDWGATVDRYLDRNVGQELRTSLIVLMCAVIAVLLIACANLANLLMARATLRSREIALRMALGARRGRVVRMLLTESLLLSGCGAIAGVAVGYGLLRWIQSLLPPYSFPAEANISLDARVLLFLAAVTIFTSIAFGLVPALQASRRDSADALREGARGASAGRSKITARNIFVGAQVAVAFVLLVGGGLLIRSFQKLLEVDMGYNTEGIVAAYLPLANERDPNPTQVAQYVNQLVEEIRSEPGMRNAAVTTALPLRGWGDGMPMFLPEKPDVQVSTGFKIVTPGYFQTLGLRLVSGRLLDERDAAGAPFAVVVNESFVKRYFPNRNPLGERILVERILVTRRGLGPKTAWEIVGVVADEKGSGLDNPTDVGTYASYAQNPVVGLGVVARGSGDTGTVLKTLQRAVWRVNKDQVLDRAMSVEKLKTDSLMMRRMPAMLLGGFSLLALFLACAGIYGVLSFVTARRTQEFGIRIALGASRADLLRLVAGGGAMPVVVGILAGFGGAVALARFIQSMLFGTEPVDGQTLVAVSFLFLAVALVACVVPAWRAARVDPMTALRQD